MNLGRQSSDDDDSFMDAIQLKELLMKFYIAKKINCLYTAQITSKTAEITDSSTARYRACITVFCENRLLQNCAFTQNSAEHKACADRNPGYMDESSYTVESTIHGNELDEPDDFSPEGGTSYQYTELETVVAMTPYKKGPTLTIIYKERILMGDNQLNEKTCSEKINYQEASSDMFMWLIRVITFLF